MSDTLLPAGKIAVQMAAWLGAILLWELATIPAVSHSNSWQGVWISISLLALSSYRLARAGPKASRMFVYGFAATVLFLPRFLGMDRFALWTQYEAPPIPVLLLWWLAIAVALGLLCAGASHLGRVVGGWHGTRSAEGATNAPAKRLRVIHFLIWTSCVAAYLGVLRWLAAQREFIAVQFQGAFAMETVVTAVESGTCLAGVLLFAWRSLRGHAFPRHPGEFLWLALGTRALFRWAAIFSAVLLSGPSTIFPSTNSYDALRAAGASLAGLVLVAAWPGASRAWRIFLACACALSIAACFEQTRYRIALLVLPLGEMLTGLMLIYAVVVDRRSGAGDRPWSHWAGIAIYLAIVGWHLVRLGIMVASALIGSAGP